MKKEIVPLVLYELEQLEAEGQPIPARDQLEARLEELAEGREVPVVVFNCLEFEWINGAKGRYPKSVLVYNPEMQISKFFQDDIALVKLGLETLGSPDLRIIVPDSEVLDERVFSFAQSREERMEIALRSKVGLTNGLGELNSPVNFWSEFCQQQGLKSPMDYTAENYERIQKDPMLQKNVREQIRDSRKYLEDNGIILKKVLESEILERTTWYVAMYMGEGQALFDSKAICLNLEDRRVPLWFQRGAQNNLPILNPVNSNKYYAWRKVGS